MVSQNKFLWYDKRYRKCYDGGDIMESEVKKKETTVEAADRVMIVIEDGVVVDVVSDNPLAVAIFDRTEKETEISLDSWSLARIDSDYITNMAGTCEVEYSYKQADEDDDFELECELEDDELLDAELDKNLLTKDHK